MDSNVLTVCEFFLFLFSPIHAQATLPFILELFFSDTKASLFFFLIQVYWGDNG